MNKMNFHKLSNWLTVSAVVLTISGTLALSAHAQTQDESLSTQKVKFSIAPAKTRPAATEAPAAKPDPEPLPYYVPLPSKWTGFYVGGNLGVVNGKAKARTTTVFATTGYFNVTSPPAINTAGAQTVTSNGFTGGGQAGYNHQSGAIVVGIEADIGAMRLRGTKSTTAPYPCCAGTNFTVTQTVKTNWLFTARPRLGVKVGNALVYGTVGVAVTKINYQALFTDTFATAHENGGLNKAKAGWVTGGGVELAVAPRWSIKAEYLFAKFGNMSTTSTNLTAPSSTAWPQNPFTHTTDLRTQIFRFGFNYHF